MMKIISKNERFEVDIEMRWGSELYASKEEEAVEIIIDGKKVRNVDPSKYLRGVFTREGECMQEIEEKIEKYGTSVRVLYSIIRNWIINFKVIKIVFHSILILTKTYRSEICRVKIREKEN